MKSLRAEERKIHTRSSKETWKLTHFYDGRVEGLFGLENKFLRYTTTCHKKHLVSPTKREIHTQNVENMWKWLKKYIKSRGSNIKKNLKIHILEYNFRKSNSDCFSWILMLLSCISTPNWTYLMVICFFGRYFRGASTQLLPKIIYIKFNLSKYLQKRSPKTSKLYEWRWLCRRNL